MVETSDISINCPGASLVALGGRHLIGAQLEEAHCTCDDPPLPDSRYTRQCTYHLVNSQGLPCGMQIRFRSGPAVYTDDSTRDELVRVGAESGWLDWVLPEDGNASDEGTGR